MFRYAFFKGFFKNIVFRSVALLKKKDLNYYSLKVTKFQGNSVNNESAWTKNAPPPSSLFKVKVKVKVKFFLKLTAISVHER